MLYDTNKMVILYWRSGLIFYESLVTRLPNKKQTACEACPGNLVANITIAVCWCPLGDLVFNNHYDYCENSKFSNIAKEHHF